MIAISLSETFTKIYIDFLYVLELSIVSQAYTVNIVLVFYFVMSCDCQLIIKENNDDDDDDGCAPRPLAPPSV